jgi:hypothetical protein
MTIRFLADENFDHVTLARLRGTGCTAPGVNTPPGPARPSHW